MADVAAPGGVGGAAGAAPAAGVDQAAFEQQFGEAMIATMGIPMMMISMSLISEIGSEMMNGE